MKIVQKKTEGSNIIVQAVASRDDVEKAFEAAYINFAQRMSLKPDGSKSIPQIAREQFAIDNLDDIVAPQVVDYLIPFAVDTLNLAPAYPPKTRESSSAIRGHELTFTCDVALKTNLRLSSYEPVRIHVPPFVLPEEQVDKQIAEMAEAYAEFVTIEPRPARMGDSCLLTILAQEEGAELPDLSAEKAVYTLGSQLISAEFDRQIVGMSAGEFKFISLEYQGLSGLTEPRIIDFEVEVLEVRERVVPVIDDAWIQQIAPGVASLEAFKELLRKEFSHSYRQEYEEMKRQKAISELAKRFEGTIPDEAMLAMQQTIINNLQNKLEQEGSDLESFIKEAGEQQFNLSTMMQSREALTQGYALDALFEHENMVLSDDDIREACKTFDSENPDMIRKQMEHSGCGYMLRETAERLKAGAWLLEHAEVVLEEAAALSQDQAVLLS